MKQVVFAIALLAMASLTGCLNTGDSPDDELIEPVGQTGYTPPDKANITVDSLAVDWVAKGGNRITTSCLNVSSNFAANLVIYDSDDRMIFLGNDEYDYGATKCTREAGVKFDIIFGPEPVKVGLQDGIVDDEALSNHFYWVVTF